MQPRAPTYAEWVYTLSLVSLHMGVKAPPTRTGIPYTTTKALLHVCSGLQLGALALGRHAHGTHGSCRLL
jgi:hypothetical protein